MLVTQVFTSPNTSAQANLALKLQNLETWKLSLTILTRVNLFPIVGGWWQLTHSGATLQRFPFSPDSRVSGRYYYVLYQLASCNTEFCIKVKSKMGLILLYILC